MRTVAKMMLLAGLGGGVSLASAADPKTTRKVTPASATMPIPSVVEPAVGYSRVTGAGLVSSTPSSTPIIGSTATTVGSPIGSEVVGNCVDGNCAPGSVGHPLTRVGHAGPHFGARNGYTLSPFGPTANGMQIGLGHAGIMPAPAMGPAGAVAAVGAFGPASMAPMYSNQRTSIHFVSPIGMQVTWQTAPGLFSPKQLVAPARYNFPQGNIYRLKITDIANRPRLTSLYPTLEVYPATPRTVTFLSHAVVPVGFSDEDLDQVQAGNLVVKVIYLPNEAFQDAAVLGGADEVVSTRLEPGVDPIVEANRRGTILAVIRMGNILLEDKNSPSMDGIPYMAPEKATPKAPVAVPPIPATAPSASTVSFNGQTIPSLPMTPAPLPTAVKQPVK